MTVKTWRVDSEPYRGPVCVWCGRGVRECGAGGAQCPDRIAHWAAPNRSRVGG